MKRSSCLSALLVGLSVTMASAFAAPDAVAQTKVAQAKRRPRAVQPADPAPTEGGTPTTPTTTPPTTTPPPPTPPTTAPADPAAPPPEPAPAPAAAPASEPATEPTPAITLGGGSTTPGADTPGGAAADPKAAPVRRWAGTQVFGQTSMTTSTLFKGQQQYSNPTVDQGFYISPRFAISDAFQIRGRIVFTYEFTNSDTTVTKNEPRFSDASLQLVYRKIPELPGGIKPVVGISTALPTSPESRARTLLFSPGLLGQLSKTFEHFLSAEWSLLATVSYAHPIYRSNTAELRDSAPYAFACAGGTTCQDQLSGAFNPSDSLSYSFMIAPAWGKWSPALFYLGNSQWAYTGKEVRNPVDGTPLESAQGRPTNVRQTSYFNAWLDYDVNSWLTPEIGYYMSRSALSEDGTRGNVFWDRYQDTRIYLGANFNIDNLMKQLEGGTGEAGVVRAQNKHKSIWSF